MQSFVIKSNEKDIKIFKNATGLTLCAGRRKHLTITNSCANDSVKVYDSIRKIEVKNEINFFGIFL